MQRQKVTENDTIASTDIIGESATESYPKNCIVIIITYIQRTYSIYCWFFLCNFLNCPLLSTLALYLHEHSPPALPLETCLDDGRHEFLSV
jgi:hypothetical protein